MSFTTRMMTRLNRCCARYRIWVNQLGSLTLYLLAAISAASGLFCFYCSGIDIMAGDDGDNTEVNYTEVNNTEVNYLITLGVYLIILGTYTFLIRSPDNDANARAPNPVNCDAVCFSKSFYQVMALAFFFSVEEPMKSKPTIFVPAVCFFAYVHVLILLQIFRQRQDHGISDGCLAAGFGLIFPMTKNNMSLRFRVIAIVMLLCGLRNLQLLNPRRFPPPAPPLPN